MSTYKLVASDLDGTLLKNDQTLSPENAAAIAEMARRGVHFAGPAAGHVACGADGTGRMVEAAEIAALIPGLLD